MTTIDDRIADEIDHAQFSSVTEDRIVRLPWSEALEEGLRAYCDDEADTGAEIEFWGTGESADPSRPGKTHWRIHLKRPAADSRPTQIEYRFGVDNLDGLSADRYTELVIEEIGRCYPGVKVNVVALDGVQHVAPWYPGGSDDDEVAIRECAARAWDRLCAEPSRAVTSREAWLAFTPNIGAASMFEDQCLSIGRELLPREALAVLDDPGSEPSPAYWQWLADQWEKSGR